MIESSFQNLNGKNGIPEFITKIYSILEKNEFENIICWSSNNCEIHIKNPKVLEEKVLPVYFRHKKIESFIRQLNMYRFSKVNKLNKEKQHMFFKNDLFRKGDLQALTSIKRKKKGHDSPELSNTDQQCSTIQSYQQFLKQNVHQLQIEFLKIRKNHPELEIEMNKLMEISSQIVGQDTTMQVQVTNYPFYPFQTIPEFKISSFQHFDSNCSIGNEMNDGQND